MIIFRFDGKTQLQMFLLLYGWSTNTIQSSLNFGETVFSIFDVLSARKMGREPKNERGNSRSSDFLCSPTPHGNACYAG